MARKKTYSVMVSSTYKDLVGHRKAVCDALVGQRMLPLDMGTDAAIPGLDLIDGSLAKVDEADAYIGLISYRYGSVPEGWKNAERFSLTELEFRHAQKRGIPICMFLMHDEHLVPKKAVLDEDIDSRKLQAFVESAKSGRIFAEFVSIDDLKAKVIQSLGELRELLDQRESAAPASNAQLEPLLPMPPAIAEKPRYIPTENFAGRAKELDLLREWAHSPEPVLLFEAIGGMGKSMLTWQWVQNQAGAQREWAGVLWYSFYERGADMNDFCVTALAYVGQRSPSEFRGKKTSALAAMLLQHLQQRPWLMVLDGLERVLVAYHRYDAAQARDDDVEADPDRAGRQPEACIRPADDDLLRNLAAPMASKILASSRLMPKALLNRAGRPLPGVSHVRLEGLAPEDAERMVRDVGVRGDSGRIRKYLAGHFGCHPLVVGVVAGLVYYFPPAPGDFDRWVDDPEGGDQVNLANLDLKQRRNHVLEAAFADLELDVRSLLARLALISTSVSWEDVDALNPRRPVPPEEVDEPAPIDEMNDFASYRLRAELRDESDPEKKRELEDRLARRRAEIETEFEREKQAWLAYLQAHEAWRQAPSLRAARQWLASTVLDLEKRGLVQRDRRSGAVDLHPVVRSFAVDSLTAEERDTSGKIVADYFSSRPNLPYDDARSPADLANGIQVVRALNLAGRWEAAFQGFRQGLAFALHKLEMDHETVALLRPFFSDGWMEPPTRITDRYVAADDASMALAVIGRFAEAERQYLYAIQGYIAQRNDVSLGYTLRNYSLLLTRTTRKADAARVTDLCRDWVRASENEDLQDELNIDRCFDCLDVDDIAEAEESMAAVRSGLASSNASRMLCYLSYAQLSVEFAKGMLCESAFDAALSRAEAAGEHFS